MSESPSAGGDDRYDTTTIALHWVTAGCVVLLWCIGQLIDDFPKGAPRIGARSVHIVLGAMLAGVLVWRLVWRIRWSRRLPRAVAGWLGYAATCGHWALYGLLSTTVVLGLGNAWIRGDSLFGLFRIPSLAPGDTVLKGRVEDLHAWSANALIVLAGLHAAVALVHHFVRHDGVLRRMLRAP